MTYVSRSEIEKVAAEPSFSKEKFFGQWFLRILDENFLGFEGSNLNTLCPQIRPLGVEECLKLWWGNKS